LIEEIRLNTTTWISCQLSRSIHGKKRDLSLFDPFRVSLFRKLLEIEEAGNTINLKTKKTKNKQKLKILFKIKIIANMYE
jgi:hypothetical protein